MVEKQEVRKCNKCNNVYLLKEFPIKKSFKSGHGYSCRACLKIYNSEYWENHKEKYRNPNSKRNNKQSESYKHLDPLARKKEYYKNHIIYVKNRKSNDLNYRLLINLRERVHKSLSAKNGKKETTSIKLFGCNLPFLRRYIESKFTKDMSWDNYGKWQIDHIIPCSLFDLTQTEQQKQCFHYTNLQPLWKHDNVVKRNKLISNSQLNLILH